MYSHSHSLLPHTHWSVDYILMQKEECYFAQKHLDVLYEMLLFLRQAGD